MIDTTGLAGFKMRESTGLGPGGVVKKDGPRELKCVRADVKQAESSGNTLIDGAFEVQDDDTPEDKGVIVYHKIVVEGMANTEPPTPNVLQLGAALTSGGRSPETIGNLAKAGQYDIEAIAKGMMSDQVDPVTGQPKNIFYGHLRVGLTSNGNPVTEIPWFLTKESYLDRKGSGRNFRTDPRPRVRGGAAGAGSAKSNGVASSPPRSSTAGSISSDI